MSRLTIDDSREPTKKAMEDINTNFTEVYAAAALNLAQKQTDFTLAAHADNAAAKTAGLVDGDLFHTAGVVYMVYTP